MDLGRFIGEVVTVNATPTLQRELSACEEVFARAFVATRNRTTAYKEAWPTSKTWPLGSLWSAASDMARKPDIAARIRQLELLSLNQCMIDARELIQRDYDIAFADPSEIVQHLHRACRNCHGLSFKYQWIDEDEFFTQWTTVAALNDSITESNRTAKKQAPLHAIPTDEGGYGYARAHSPHAGCPVCLGVGDRETVIADTRTLEGRAARLFKGMKMTSSGPEPLMHDQDAALERLQKMAGLHQNTDLASALTAALGGAKAKDAPQLPSEVNPQDAARGYLALLNAG